jgi:anti-sigma B factor antagonist
MPLDIETFKTGDLAFIKLKGSLTTGVSLNVAENRVQQIVAEGAKKLVLDVSQVTFADSSGLGMLVQSFGIADRSGCKLRIAGANEKLRSMLHVTRMDSVLSLDSDVNVSLMQFYCPADEV